MNERRKAANRANACRSTGPKTPEGKRAVRLNGIRHGLTSRDVVLPGEDEGVFEELRRAIHADLAPSGSLETWLADRVVNAIWRLQRVERVEATLFHWRNNILKAELLAAKVRTYEKTTGGFEMPLLGEPWLTTITDEAAHENVSRELSAAKFEQEREEVLVGRAFNSDTQNGDTFSTLSRYETAIERSLYKALHELQRLQSARRGRPVPAPHAVDVDVAVV